uniref:RiboL-PSP-HEPN domain-containing protein n=1 Tax=Candidatus Kentrum sp. TC TaxID=2126339 RepID=A0A450YCL8_9GAMM|nr:MAG: hypothetical protein BECKTC1821E_GA0114239_100472 [Candidatus Kentron sp. TC]VFK43968.1 MAG: hypothetical protein BECKTC1821D_GA0114238_101932 [Candidatus Kentron sp. TC]
MNPEDFREEIEKERQWREDEIAFLDKVQRSLERKEDRERIRRAIVCILYAHVEGFVYFIFSHYIDGINRQNLTCARVRPAIAAAAFHREFIALKDSKKKNPFFRKRLPDENHLHGLSRQIEFIENIAGFYDHPISISDDFINTEGNIGPETLEKLLFQIGLEYQDVEDIRRKLYRLLNVRNDIAHGKRKEGIKDKDYEDFRRCFRKVIDSISNKIITAYREKEFLTTDETTTASMGDPPLALRENA